MIQQQIQRMTIDDMIRLDPRIGELLSEANIPTDIPYWHRYSHFKRLLSQHVGDYASVAGLRSCACYETMIAALCQALPGDEHEK